MHQGRSEALAVGLAWFSIALGVAELAAPRLVARAAGMRGRESLVRLCGLREIATAPKRKAALPLAAVSSVTAVDVGCALALGAEHRRAARVFDYRDRSGMPRPPAEMRGAARRLIRRG